MQETGTWNFFLIDDNALLTKPVDEQFLPGITRDSLLRLAEEFEYDVIEQNFNVDSLLDWIKYGEAALCGTAAVLTPVATFVYQDKRYEVCGGGHVARLKQALLDIQFGLSPDRFGWLSADLRDMAPAAGR